MQSQRLYYLDWLRALAFGLIIIFHCARFFDFMPWHIKNGDQSEFAMQFLIFTSSWHMPLLFFVSGAGTYFAIHLKKSGFVKVRIKRLLIPYIFGILVLIPPQKFYEYIFYNPDTNITAWEYFTNYPDYIFNVNFGFSLIWLGHLGYHLWYLPYLLIQTLLFLPFLRWLAQNPLKCFIQNRVQLILFLFVPLVLVNVALRPFFPAYLSWADFMHFSYFFLLGFVVVKFSDELMPLIQESWLVLLIIAVLTTLSLHYLALYTPYMIKWFDRPDLSWDYLGYVTLRSINGVSWVMTSLILAHKYLKNTHPLLPKINEAILPVYLLHQTVIVVLGYYVVQWTFGIFAKYMIILVCSCIVIWGLYVVVERVNILRYLFGMKMKD